MSWWDSSMADSKNPTPGNPGRTRSVDSCDFQFHPLGRRTRAVQIWAKFRADYSMKYYIDHRPASLRAIWLLRPSEAEKYNDVAPNRTMSSSPSRPTRAPSLERWAVVSLSTIRRLLSRSPFIGVGSMGSRINGASVGSVENAQIVTASVESNRSS